MSTCRKKREAAGDGKKQYPEGHIRVTTFKVLIEEYNEAKREVSIFYTAHIHTEMPQQRWKGDMLGHRVKFRHIYFELLFPILFPYLLAF